MRFLYRLMGDRQSAEDAFQEAFLQVHLSADSFDIGRRFKPWLFTIAANKGRDFLRRKQRRRTLDLSAPVGGGGSNHDGNGEPALQFIDLMEVDVPAPSAGLDISETSRQVQDVLDNMPLPLREILLLAYFQRLSYAQIAEDLEIPLGTVKSRLHSAVAVFARGWTENTGESTNPRRGESRPPRGEENQS